MMGTSIQRLRWLLLAGALLLVAVLAATIGYGRYRMLTAYRRVVARSGVTISHDSNGVTYSQSVGGKKIFTLRAAKETSLGNGRWALHDADLLLYTRNAESPDHIYGKEFEYDQKAGIARALGDVYMDLQAPEALAGKRPSGQPQRGRGAGLADSEPATAVSTTGGPIIHVRTSRLVYLRKLGVAATDQEVEFQYGGMQCTALGADFNTGQNVLHLLARVTMDGTAHGQPVHLTAIRADLDRTANTANLMQPVVVSDDRRATASQAVLQLRPDGSLDQAHAMGDVVLIEGTRQIKAERLDAALSPQAVPETAKLSGGVILIDSNVRRPVHGTANEVDAVFTAQGVPQHVVATGAAQLSLLDSANPGAGAHGLERSIQGASIEALFVPGGRKATTQLSELRADGDARAQGEALVAAPSGPSLLRTQTPGAQSSAAAQIKTVRVDADDLRVLFAVAGAHQVQPQRLYGVGHTQLRQDAPLGAQEISRGDTLQAVFASETGVQNPIAAAPAARKEPLTIVSAVQAGHVTLYDRAGRDQAGGGEGAVSSGSAQRAVYDGAAQTLTLAGGAHVESSNFALSAPTVVLNQETGNAVAMGGVETTMLNAGASTAGQAPGPGSGVGPGSSGEGRTATVTHVLSASASLNRELKLSEFRGSDREPARMWQDASQVEAADLIVDGKRHSFSARPAAAGALVHAVFAQVPAQVRPGAASVRPATAYVRVAGPRMDYNDLLRQATFAGGVRIEGNMGEVRGQGATVFLAPAAQPSGARKAGERSAEEPAAAGSAQRQPGPAQPTRLEPTPLGGTLDRVVVSGNVQMEQPGRRGSCQQLLYTAATGTYVMTGSPGHLPHIEDAGQGSVTGATLVVRDAGSTIVVAGAPGAKPGHGRVRTETEVRQ